MRVRPVVLVMLGCVAAVVATALLTVPFPVLQGAHPHVDVQRDFTAAQISRAAAFHAALHPPAYLGLVVGVTVSALLGLTKVGSRWVARLPGPWWVQAALGVVVVLVIGQLAVLAPDIASERVLLRYGLSTQDWPSWTADLARGLLIRSGTTVLAVLVLLALARRQPVRWWATGAIAAVVLTFGGSFLYPLVVEPAFNRFTPLPAGALRTDLLALAGRDHVRVTDVLVADASRRTTSLNAYVSGFGSTRRIVVYDTLLRGSSPREVELVVAHELGHAKRQDVLHGTVMGALAGAAGVCALFLLLSWPPLLRRAGADGPGDPKVVPLVLLLATAAPLLLLPLTNLVSRHVEARADLHALDLTHDPATFVASERHLSTVNLSDLSPPGWAYALFFTHPTGPERIAFAREWERLHP